MHIAYAEILENVRGRLIGALVGGETEREVGLHGIETGILKRVRPYFIAQPYAPAFLTCVHDDARSCLSDPPHALFKLFAAIAPEREKRVAREARGVDSHEHVLPGLAEHERRVFTTVENGSIGRDGKCTVSGRELRGSDADDGWAM